MSKIITQKAEENKYISERIKKFMKRFDVSSALKSSNAFKIKGFAVIEIFQYLFMLVFMHRSVYMDMKKEHAPFAEDTVYRFLNAVCINWLKFTTKLSAKIIEDAIEPLTSETRKNVLIIDDSVFERNRSKKVEYQLTLRFLKKKSSKHTAKDGILKFSSRFVRAIYAFQKNVVHYPMMQ